MRKYINKSYKLYKKYIKPHVPRSVFIALAPILERRFTIALKQSEGLERFLFNRKQIENLILEKLDGIFFERKENPKVSIVIPVFNKWQYTYNCLQSLKKNVGNVSFEIVIVDNGSSDSTPQMMEKISGVNYIRNDKNLGFVGGCNLGAMNSKGEYIVFLNNDTFVLRGWLENLIDVFQKKERVGLVGSKLVYPNGQLQEAGGIVWKNESAWNYGRFKDPNNYEFNYLKEVDYCSGASIMLPKKLFDELGGFDELYAPAYYEDTDLAFRVRRAGFKTIYQPKSELIHFEGVTAGKDTKKGLKQYQEINKSKFYSRWKEVLEKENFSDTEEKQFLSRDKSKNKKVVLFIDNTTPTFNQDAGSFIAFEYLKILQELGYKVIFWPHDLRKIEPYTSALQQEGIEVIYGSLSLSDFLSQNGAYIEYAFVSRPNYAKKYIDVIKKYTSAKILYVAHDLHYLRESRELETTGEKKEFIKNINVIKSLEKIAIENSDTALFFSDQEVEIVKKEFNANAQIIPWIQPLNISQEQKKFENRAGILFVGGFRHRPNVDAIKWFKEEIFPIVQKENPQIAVTIVGSNPTNEILELNEDNFNVLGFIENVDPYFEKARIFIAPLRFGAGFKGKISLSMSYGVPVITTNIGSEGIGLTNHENAIITDDAHEMARQIIELYKYEDLWTKISQNSIDYIRQNFSKENAKEKLLKILKSL